MQGKGERMWEEEVGSEYIKARQRQLQQGDPLASFHTKVISTHETWGKRVIHTADQIKRSRT